MKTKQNTTNDRGILSICKKAPLSLLLVFCMLTVYAFKNFPPELTTRGGIDPIELCEGCWDEEEWTFDNQTGCSLTVELGVTFTQGGGSPVNTGLSPFTLLPHSSQTLTFTNIYAQLSLFTGSGGPFILTNVGAEIGIGGYYGYGYPDGSVRLINPDAPCPCVIWIPDFANRKIIFKNC